MRTGGILLIGAAVLTCTACLGGGGKLEIRSAGNGLKAADQPVPYRIAEARGQLALGNVALALEGFRKAAREDPASIEALAGIAQCYDRMARFDLSRRHYERALALAPRNRDLLTLLAGSLDRQGLAAEAGSVRQEIAALAAAAAQTVEAAPAQPGPELASVAKPVPDAPMAAAPVGQSVTIALPPPRPADPPKAHAQIQEKAPQSLAVAPVGRSVTIALPPPRPVAASRQPRIERLSLTEVALFTGDGPRWKRQAPTPVRMAKRTMPVRQAEVRILNAARVEKLAARTRAYLGRHGWGEIVVGDAEATRQRSLILYPAANREAAGRLARRLGFAMAPRSDVRQLTILLGRDAAALPALRPDA